MFVSLVSFVLLTQVNGQYDVVPAPTGKTEGWRLTIPKVFDGKATLPNLRSTTPGTAANDAAWKNIRTNAAQVVKIAKEEAKSEFGLRSPYTVQVDTIASYNTPRLASLVTGNYQYTGGAHGNYFFRAYNYGAIEGPLRPLKTRDFFAKGSNWTQDVTFAIFAKIRSNPAASWVQQGEIREFKEQDLQTIGIHADGLTFYFDPYALGSWADGPFKIKLSIEELGPNFKKGWLLQR